MPDDTDDELEKLGRGGSPVYTAAGRALFRAERNKLLNDPALLAQVNSVEAYLGIPLTKAPGAEETSVEDVISALEEWSASGTAPEDKNPSPVERVRTRFDIINDD